MSTTTATETRTGTWQIDPAHTQVEFEVQHMMFAKVRGRFEDLEGTIAVTGNDGRDALSVSVAIPAASLTTGHEDRDKHLRSGDFFDVEQFPRLTFEAKDTPVDGSDSFTLTGDLTIRDVTRSVALGVTETGRGIDPWGDARVGFRASATIDRRDFGLTWNQALEAGGVLVGHEVRILIEGQAVLPSDS